MIPSNWLEAPNWIEYTTFAILVVIGVGQFFRWRFGSSYSAARMWNLGFDTLGGEWPPAPAINRGLEKTLKAELNTKLGDTSIWIGQFPIRVKANSGILVSEIDIRFVTKEKRSKWNPNNPVSVKEIIDAHAETYFDYFSDDYPKERDDFVGGKVLRYTNPKGMLAGDSFWLRLEIQSSVSWSGYLEFFGPTPHGVRGYCRRKITVNVPTIPNPDKEDSQN
jgi:hypothetical protein